MFGNKRLETNVTPSSNFTGLCIKLYLVRLQFCLEIFHLLDIGDYAQPGYAGREEIFSTLRGDENTHRGRL